MSRYPKVKNQNLVGTYPAAAKSGGGYVLDDVLEYRVWCHPHNGAPNLYEGDDYYFTFGRYEEAHEFSKENPGSEEPLALIVQEEYIAEAESNNYVHINNKELLSGQ